MGESEILSYLKNLDSKMERLEKIYDSGFERLEKVSKLDSTVDESKGYVRNMNRRLQEESAKHTQPRKLDMTKIKIDIPNFTGSHEQSEFENWKRRLEYIFLGNNYSEAEKVQLATHGFKGLAHSWWQWRIEEDFIAGPINTWEALVDDVRVTFFPRFFERQSFDYLKLKRDKNKKPIAKEEVKVEKTTDQKKKNVTCFNCKNKGHFANKCPSVKKEVAPKSGDLKRSKSGKEDLNAKDEKEVTKKLKRVEHDVVKDLKGPTRSAEGAKEDMTKPVRVSFEEFEEFLMQRKLEAAKRIANPPQSKKIQRTR